MQRMLLGNVTAAPQRAILKGRVSTQSEGPPPEPGRLYANVSADGSLWQSAQPATGLGRQQIVGYRIQINHDGGGVTELEASDLLPPIEFSEELGVGSRLSFGLPLILAGTGDPGLTNQDRQPWMGSVLNNRALPNIGNFWTLLGLPPGNADVSLVGIYATSNGVREIPLMTGARVESVQMVALPAGRALRLTFVDRKVLYLDRQVDYMLPPGHRRSKGTIAQQVLAKAGVPSDQLAIDRSGSALFKAVQLIDANAWSSAEAYLAAEGRVLHVDRRGKLTSPDLVDTTSRVVATLTGSDIASAVVDQNSQFPTFITLTAVRQSPPEERAEGITLVSRVNTATDDTFVPQAAVQRQDGTGDLDAIAPVASGRQDGLVSRVTTRQIYQGDIQIGEEVIEESYFNLERSRYELNTDGSFDYRAGVYLFEAGVPDDTTPAFRWPVDRFGVRSRSVMAKQFDDRGFNVLERTRLYGPVMRRARVKERANAGVDFEGQPFVDGQHVTADGQGVPTADRGEVLAGIEGLAGTASAPMNGLGAAIQEESIKRFEVTDDGYIVRESFERWGWRQLPGLLHLYADQNSTSDNEAWQFVVVEREDINYVPGDGNDAKRVTSRWKFGEGQLPIETEKLDGYLPAAERNNQATIESEEFTEEEAAEFASFASFGESEDLSVQVAFEALESVVQRKAITEVVDIIDNESDLGKEARRRGRLRSAPRVTITTIGLNLLVPPAVRIHVDFAPAELDHDVHIVGHRFTDSGKSSEEGSGLRSSLIGRIYVV